MKRLSGLYGDAMKFGLHEGGGGSSFYFLFKRSCEKNLLYFRVLSTNTVGRRGWLEIFHDGKNSLCPLPPPQPKYFTAPSYFNLPPPQL